VRSNPKRPRDLDAHVAFDLGPLYHLGTIDIVGEAPACGRGVCVNLASGAPAVAADVLAAAEPPCGRALQDDGYAYARVDHPPMRGEDATQTTSST